MDYIERAHYWLADRVNWVQYPRIDPFKRRAPLFLNSMPWHVRIGLVVYGFGILAVCAVALLLLGVVVWAIITG
jgi:hypothetical protein